MKCRLSVTWLTPTGRLFLFRKEENMLGSRRLFTLPSKCFPCSHHPSDPAFEYRLKLGSEEDYFIWGMAKSCSCLVPFLFSVSQFCGSILSLYDQFSLLLVASCYLFSPKSTKHILVIIDLRSVSSFVSSMIIVSYLNSLILWASSFIYCLSKWYGVEVPKIGYCLET